MYLQPARECFPRQALQTWALALSSLLARIVLEKVAAFFAVAGEPLLKFPGVCLLAWVSARARANFLRALIFLQCGFHMKKTITHQMIWWFTTLAEDAVLPDGGWGKDRCVDGVSTIPETGWPEPPFRPDRGPDSYWMVELVQLFLRRTDGSVVKVPPPILSLIIFGVDHRFVQRVLQELEGFDLPRQRAYGME